jgi:hypothetical protein
VRCDLESIGVSSIFKLIRRTATSELLKLQKLFIMEEIIVYYGRDKTRAK